MQRYREFAVGKEAISYIKDILSNGKTLSKWLLKQVNLEEGRITTFLPESVDIASIKDFGRGGITGYEWVAPCIVGNDRMTIAKIAGQEVTRLWVVESVYNFLIKGEMNVSVFENAPASKGDPWVTRAKSRIVTFGEEIYHILTDSPPKEAIKEALIEAESWILVGVMSSLSLDYRVLLEQGKMTSRLLRRLAFNTEKIVVSAFDHEGFLLWTRSSTITKTD